MVVNLNLEPRICNVHSELNPFFLDTLQTPLLISSILPGIKNDQDYMD